MTDKQRALAAIEALNKARDLLESSSDQAQHDIAEELGSLVTKLKSLKFTTVRPLAYSFSFDADSKQWIVTEEFLTCYAVIAAFRTRDAAMDYVQAISNGGRR